MRKKAYSIIFLGVFCSLILSLTINTGCSSDSSSDPSSTKDITAFSFTAAANSELSIDITATISGTNITAKVTPGAAVTALVATFTTTGSSVQVGTTDQESGTTANDYSSAVTYTVTAADGTTQDYTVTVTVGKLHLFAESDDDRNGNLGGRSGADSLCAASTNKPTGVTTAYAFISVDASDTIATLPANKGFSDSEPVYAPDGTTPIGSNWNDLLDSDIGTNTLYSLGVLATNPGDVWWSGSDADGTIDTNSYTCNGWTSSSASDRGEAGINNASNADYISIDYGTCDATGFWVLCIGY